jgi:hypothetical protein
LWSNSRLQALFMEHEGYLGALGAYLLYEPTSETNETNNSELPRPQESKKSVGKQET